MIDRDASQAPIQGVLRSLFRHKRKAVAFFIVVVTGTVVLTFAMPKKYRSVGKLFVRLGRENATLDPTATLGQNPIVAMPQSRDNEINSVVEILQSRALVEKVVDLLGPGVVLDSDAKSEPAAAQEAGSWFGRATAGIKDLLVSFSSSAGLDDRQRAILLMSKNIEVEAAKKSSVIEIAYRGPSPEQCQSVVAALVDSYLDEHMRLNRARGSHDFFADQTRRLREELSRREAELRDLKDQTGLASPETQRKLLVTRIGRLEDDLLEVESSRAVAQAKVDNLRATLSTLPKTVVTSETDGFGDEGTNRIRDRFYALQVLEKEAAAKYTDDHPKMKQLREQVADARAILDREEPQRKQVTTGPDKLHQQAEAAILAEEPSLASLAVHADRLQAQLAGAREDLAALNDNEMRVAALQREVDLLEDDYRKYASDLEQSRIDQELENQRMSNISIVQPASYEPRPIRPRKLPSLLLGIGVGVFGGLALPLALDSFGGAPSPPERARSPLQSSVSTRGPRLSAGRPARHRRKVPR